MTLSSHPDKTFSLDGMPIEPALAQRILAFWDSERKPAKVATRRPPSRPRAPKPAASE